MPGKKNSDNTDSSDNNHWGSRWSHHRKMDPGWTHWNHEAPSWSFEDSNQRKKFFFRFFGVFLLISLLAIGGLSGAAYLVAQLFGGGGKMASLVWLFGCGISIALPILAIAVGLRAFRGIASPIADIMEAADAVTSGNLSIRVEERKHGPHEFQRLAHSFNRMTEELERLEVQRQNLTADIAHELRTPLHIIQGNLEGILDGVYEPNQEQIQILLDEIHLLTRLVNDLQTLSLVESGELPLKIENVRLKEILRDIYTSFSGQTEAVGVNLVIEPNDENDGGDDFAADDPLTIEADPERLDQIFTNLVANALRYTTKGETIKLEAKTMDHGVRIIVKDNGEGIPPDDLPYIFDRFWKGNRSHSRLDGSGSGLGLAITRKLIESHGGHISVESDLGTGTTFTIDLPKNQSLD